MSDRMPSRAALGTRPSLTEQVYEAAKQHPVASLILAALHEQDARTYHGDSGDIGALALNTAVQIAALLDAGKGSSHG